MKRHLLYPISILVIGMFIFSACGNDTKSKPISNKVSEKIKLEDTSPEGTVDTSKVSSLLADANSAKEIKEEVKVEKKEQSFNPPHIPVFNEEKVKPEPSKTKPKEKSKRKASKQSSKNIEPKNIKPKAIVKKTSKTKAIPAKVNQMPKSKATEIVWRRNFYSFGDIMQGDTVYFKFEFTNIGDQPLEIESATPSCDCTFPSFSFIPVESNAKGEIKGMYISDETKKGTQNAMIQVVANTDPPIHKLYIDGNVLLPEGNSKDAETKGN